MSDSPDAVNPLAGILTVEELAKADRKVVLRERADQLIERITAEKKQWRDFRTSAYVSDRLAVHPLHVPTSDKNVWIHGSMANIRALASGMLDLSNTDSIFTRLRTHHHDVAQTSVQAMTWRFNLGKCDANMFHYRTYFYRVMLALWDRVVDNHGELVQIEANKRVY